MKCKVSIIIPVFNVSKYIEDCLSSVTNQTMTEGVECILIDDCGTDNSVAIAEAFIKQYNGAITFKIYRHKQNLGPSCARNTGILNACGKYIYFLDSDDYIEKNCLRNLYKFVEQYKGVDVVQGSYIDDGKGGLPHHPSYSDDKKTIKTWLLTYNGKILVPHNRLIKRDFILKNSLFFKNGIIHEDNLWVFYLAKHVSSIAFCNKQTYYHRCHSNSITGNVDIKQAALSYKTIIEDMCLNIDPFLKGGQKEFILNNLLTVLNSRYYETNCQRRQIINTFAKTNNWIERYILKVILEQKGLLLKTKLRHLLIRIYKRND